MYFVVSMHFRWKNSFVSIWLNCLTILRFMTAFHSKGINYKLDETTNENSQFLEIELNLHKLNAEIIPSSAFK